MRLLDRSSWNDKKAIEYMDISEKEETMGDYIRRLLIAAIMLLFVSLLFLGGRHSEAQTPSISDRTTDWTWPSEGIISDTYNTRNGNHKGIDIAGDLGDSVYVVDSGDVTRSYYSESYGNVVFVKHENGLETVYAHLNKRLVNEHDVVKKGDLIGEMGNTGHSSGVHLHFEIHKEEWTVTKVNAIDPMVALGEVEVGQTVKIAEIKEENKLKSEEQPNKKQEQGNSFKLELLYEEEQSIENGDKDNDIDDQDSEGIELKETQQEERELKETQQEERELKETQQEERELEETKPEENVQVDSLTGLVPYKKTFYLMKSSINMERNKDSHLYENSLPSNDKFQNPSIKSLLDLGIELTPS